MVMSKNQIARPRITVEAGLPDTTVTGEVKPSGIFPQMTDHKVVLKVTDPSKQSEKSIITM